MKECSTCLYSKKLTEFHKKSSGKFQRSSKCKTCTQEYTKLYNKKNKKLIDKKNKIRYQEKAEYNRKQAKKYRASNKDIINPTWNAYDKERKAKDPTYKLKRNIRALIRNSLKKQNYRKKSKTAQILGCSYENLFSHLRRTFELNYGIPFSHINTKLLQIDHIIPLSSAKTEEELLKLNHYSNLQYLFAWDNLEKGDKLDWSIS